jgi:two-component system, OmpR family, response regulator
VRSSDGAGEAIRVLLIDDGAEAACRIASFLETHRMLVSCEGDAASGISALRRTAYDVVLLCSMLPGIGGVAVCREVRARSDVPILMTTFRGGESDCVPGLEAGADDVIGPLFAPRELLARIRAHVRRARGLCRPTTGALVVGALTVDTGSIRATLDGKILDLTESEFVLLRVLAERSGRVLSREQLLELARGNAENAFDRAIDVQVSRLRRKIEADPRQPRRLKTVRGRGYTLVDGDIDRETT